MADAADSKSADGDIVRVQVPSSAPLLHSILLIFPHFFPIFTGFLFFQCYIVPQRAMSAGYYDCKKTETVDERRKSKW